MEDRINAGFYMPQVNIFNVFISYLLTSRSVVPFRWPFEAFDDGGKGSAERMSQLLTAHAESGNANNSLDENFIF